MNIIFSHKQPHQYKIHRKIDNGMHFIIFTEQSKNPLSNQGIKIGEKIYKLVFFEKSSNNLSYYFEKNVALKFYNNGTAIMVNFIYPKLKKNEFYEWNYNDATTYDSLSWNDITKEIDYLNVMAYEFVHNLKNKAL